MKDDKPKQVMIAHGYTMKPDGSIVFHEGVPPEVQREIIEKHAAHLDYEAERRALWGEPGPEAMTRLAKMFPSLRGVPGTDPWDSMRLLEWLCGPAPTSGSHLAALFVLGVWNNLDWNEVARSELPERECPVCKGIGRVSRDEGGPVERGSTKDTFRRPRYDDDGNQIGYVEVSTNSCELCDGNGRYVPSPGVGRFNLFRALGVWDGQHRAAFETWVKFPFWP